MSDVFATIAAVGMAVGPPLVYADQAISIVRKKDSTGFSHDVCGVLLIANIIRIYFWLGNRFELPLLVQSILLIISQLLLLSICLQYRPLPDIPGSSAEYAPLSPMFDAETETEAEADPSREGEGQGEGGGSRRAARGERQEGRNTPPRVLAEGGRPSGGVAVKNQDEDEDGGDGAYETRTSPRLPLDSGVGSGSGSSGENAHERTSEGSGTGAGPGESGWARMPPSESEPSRDRGRGGGRGGGGGWAWKPSLRSGHGPAGVGAGAGAGDGTGTKTRPWGFWQWDGLGTYLEFLAGLILVMGVMQVVFGRWMWYIDTIGFIALAIESTLPVPQFISNYRRKSCYGFRSSTLAGWLFGDMFKTGYFFLRNAPTQFKVTAIMTVCWDVAVLVQRIVYKAEPPIGAREREEEDGGREALRGSG